MLEPKEDLFVQGHSPCWKLAFTPAGRGLLASFLRFRPQRHTPGNWLPIKRRKTGFRDKFPVEIRIRSRQLTGSRHAPPDTKHSFCASRPPPAAACWLRFYVSTPQRRIPGNSLPIKRRRTGFRDKFPGKI